MQQGVFDYTAPADAQSTGLEQCACLAYRRIALPPQLAQQCRELEERRSRAKKPGLLARLGLGHTADAAADLAAEAAELAVRCDAALSVCADAVPMDILCRSWRPSDEAITSLVQLGDFVNLPMRAWVQDNCLSLAWQGAVYTLPLAAIGPAQKVDQKLLLPRWNKTQPANAACWRPWKLTVGTAGVYVRPYYQFELAGSGLVLRVPAYELPALLTLLGRQDAIAQL